MSRQASVVCVAERKPPGLIAALTSGIRYPVVEMRPAEAARGVAEVEPAALVFVDREPDPHVIAEVRGHIETAKGQYVPILAHLGGEAEAASVLPIPSDGSIPRLIARLTSALRIRALYATVQRRDCPQALRTL